RAILAVRAIGIVFLAAAILQVPRPGFGPTEAVVAVFGTDLDFGQAEPLTTRLTESVAAAASGARNSVGWVANGAVVTVARDLDDDLPVERPETTDVPGADLQRATLLAAAMLPGDRPGRVVAVADGNETSGRLADATAQLQARGVPVDALPLSALPAGEVVVERVGVPPSVREGDVIPLEAIVLSAADATARVSIFRDGALVTEQEIRLRSGRNRVEATVAAGEAGNALFEVAVGTADDVFEANNRNGAVAAVRAAPSVLVIASDTEWARYYADALAVQSLTATVIGPEDAPWYIYDWLKYDLVVLMNVPAIDLDTRQQALLEDFVEVHGGGLLILGGEHAFGPGGYYQTALERISPLSSRIPHDAPRAAMAFVLDRSGSMQAMVDGASRLEIAKVATLSAVDLLHEESQVAVVVFDSEARVLVPLQERKDQAAVAAALAPIVPAGGTALLPALTAGFAELQNADADARHIVIMTDGLVEAADFGPLLADIRAAGITVSAVAMGDAAEVRRAETIARLGGGAFHATRDFNALPSILSQEALQMSGDPIKEGTTPVFWSDRSAAFLAGLPDELPALENFVTTTAQPGATVHLALSDEADETIPVLASWRYGAGRVVAFASHGAGSGTQNWMRIPEYPLLWAQTIRHLVPDVEGPGLHATIERRGDEAFLTADLLDRDGAPIAGDTVTVASVETPDQTRALIETAPGRYELALGAIGSGTHRFTVASPAAETEAVLHAAYPARLDFGRADPDRLTALAAATGGAVLAADAPFLEVSRGWLMKAEWRLWALIALALFLVDLAIRYTPDLLRIGRRASRPNTR
ncbi:MAG: VWA domain-containing protein, partial [Bauldia sp.]|nr:VWA domain-containing protein [Bauldia sp.]